MSVRACVFQRSSRWHAAQRLTKITRVDGRTHAHRRVRTHPTLTCVRCQRRYSLLGILSRRLPQHSARHRIGARRLTTTYPIGTGCTQGKRTGRGREVAMHCAAAACCSASAVEVLLPARGIFPSKPTRRHNGRIRCSIVVSISACHAEDPRSIPGGGVLRDSTRKSARSKKECETRRPPPTTPQH